MLIIIVVALGVGLGLGLKKDDDASNSSQTNEGFFRTAAVATDAEPCSKVFFLITLEYFLSRKKVKTVTRKVKKVSHTFFEVI